MKVALVGGGYWGRNYARILKEYSDKDIELKVVCDRSEAACNDIENEFGCYTTTSISEVIYGNVDAVIICTPCKTHYKIASDCLKSGKHVLVEKPLTYTSKEAQELCYLASDKKLVLQVGHTFEYNLLTKYIQQILNQNYLGRIYYMDFVRVGMSPVRQDVSALWDLATHDISMALSFIGEQPEYVRAYGNSYLQDGLEDVVTTHLHFGNNVIANIHCSWLNPVKERKVTIVGSEKMLVFDDIKREIVIYDKFGTFTPQVEYAQPLTEQIDDFFYAIEHGTQPLVTGNIGLSVVKILEKCQKSIENDGQKIKT